MWVQRGSLASPASILAAVEMAKAGRFNTLIVQVRGRGDAYYDSRYEPRPPVLAKQPASFDPLALMLERAHRAGLKVHAWVNVNLISEAEPPAARKHVVYTHPEWLMVPRPLARILSHDESRATRNTCDVCRSTRRRAATAWKASSSPLFTRARLNTPRK